MVSKKLWKEKKGNTRRTDRQTDRMTRDSMKRHEHLNWEIEKKRRSHKKEHSAKKNIQLGIRSIFNMEQFVL